MLNKINKIKRGRKSGVSEMVSYVILISIGITIAVAVFAWLSGWIAPGNNPVCPEDISLIIKSYECPAVQGSAARTINLVIENKGLFNADGFYIKASENSAELPSIELKSARQDLNPFKGIYEFKTDGESTPLAPGAEADAGFLYGDLTTIKKIMIIPFVYNEKHKRALCSYATINTEIQNC